MSDHNVDVRIGSGFRVGSKIGSGSFGDIYGGFNLQTGEEVAIKLEHAKRRNPHLLYECKLYKILAGAVGIPDVHWYGVEGEYNVMVMDLLGPSLEDLFNFCGRVFSTKTTLMLADQMLDRIEHVHAQGVIHRDIKPHNFLIGRRKTNTEHTVYVIDFGLAKRYKEARTGYHIPFRQGKSLTGTARYVSINTHMGMEQSRRDDLESLGYVFIYFLKGSLPWQGLKANSKKDKYDLIEEKKQSTSLELLCETCPSAFYVYLKYCRALRFLDRPDYSYLKKLIKDLMMQESYEYDYVFDWSRLSNNKEKEKEKHDENSNPKKAMLIYSPKIDLNLSPTSFQKSPRRQQQKARSNTQLTTRPDTHIALN